jgi:signal transduction histidine kinase
VDLSSLVANLAMTFAAVAEDSGKTLKEAIAPGVHIPGDRELLTQLLVNLIENALRHTPEGATISMSLRGESGGPVLEISDDGNGIPEAERRNVFKRFYRLERSRSTSGSGLGLALVAAVAELHAAEIQLTDNHPGLKATLRLHDSAHVKKA